MTESGRARSVLLADIGGTTSRFALIGANGRPEHVVAVADDEADGLAPAIERFLAGAPARPDAGVLAIAGALGGDEIVLTNRAWRFSLRDLSARFGLVPLRAINDFEAIAWALPALAADEVAAIGPVRTAAPEGVRVVFGPGTGLGVAALVPVGAGWRAIASEGGHASFGAAAADEEPVFARLRAAAPASAEAVLSGPGLARLYRAFDAGSAKLAPEAIVAAARSGETKAAAVVRMFTRLLGRFAGDLALTFKATGGVYIAGGVAAALQSLLEPQVFRDAFEAHPPYRHLLASIPSWHIRESEPGLLGCAVYARQMLEAGPPGESRVTRAERSGQA